MMELEKLPPIHPGEILSEEFLAPLGMSESQLAKAIGVDAELIRAITNNEQHISAEIALLLSRYFGTSAELWTGIQTHYDLEIAKDRIMDRLRAIKPCSANRITPNTVSPSRGECQCGCGGVPNTDARFLQGHDQKALHKVIKREYGSVSEFLRHHSYPYDIALTRHAAEK